MENGLGEKALIDIPKAHNMFFFASITGMLTIVGMILRMNMASYFRMNGCFGIAQEAKNKF